MYNIRFSKRLRYGLKKGRICCDPYFEVISKIGIHFLERRHHHFETGHHSLKTTHACFIITTITSHIKPCSVTLVKIIPSFEIAVAPRVHKSCLHPIYFSAKLMYCVAASQMTFSDCIFVMGEIEQIFLHEVALHIDLFMLQCGVGAIIEYLQMYMYMIYVIHTTANHVFDIANVLLKPQGVGFGGG